MKLTKGIHTRYNASYKVRVLESESKHQVRFYKVWREDKGWQVRGVTRFGSNVVIFKIMVGRKQWYVAITK